VKLISWNVNGLRAVLRKSFLDYFDSEAPDIFCLQETKAGPDDVEQLWPVSYTTYWNTAEKKGYSGTAIFTKTRPLNVSTGIGIEKHDREGRVLTAEFGDFFLVNVYVPNSQRELGRPPQGDLLQYLAKQPPGKSSVLAELRKDAAVFSVLQGTKLISPPAGFLSSEKPPQYVLSTTTLLLLRGKTLQLTAFTSLDSADDLDWLKTITERWIGELLRLNR